MLYFLSYAVLKRKLKKQGKIQKNGIAITADVFCWLNVISIEPEQELEH